MISYTSKKSSDLPTGVWLRVSKYCFWGSRCFQLRGKDIIYSTSLSYQRRQLTEEEYSTIYKNLEILHKFAGSSYGTLQMKIGPIQRYSIDYNIMKFEGNWGSTYEEKRSLAR